VEWVGKQFNQGEYNMETPDSSFLPNETQLAEAQKIVAAMQAAGQIPTPQAIVAMMSTRDEDGGPQVNPNMAPVNPVALPQKTIASAVAPKKKVVAVIYEDFTWALV
jgi:hypothetical protein